MQRVEFHIEVEMADDESTATVRIFTSGPHPLAAQMAAVENMMTMFAVSSDAGFEKALDLLCQGARANRIKAVDGKPLQDA